MFACHPLIATLDAAVCRDGAPSGLRGAVAVGVVGQTGTDWLEVRLDGVAQAARVADPSDDASWLVLGEREASAMAFDGALPRDAELVKVVGDRELILGFARRYLRRFDSLTVRVGR